MRPFLTDVAYTSENFTKNTLPKGDYEGCTFTNCQFQESYLDNQHFIDCVFQDCDFTNANIAHTQFNGVDFSNCKLVGVHFETCDPLLLNFSFTDCNLNLASFYEMDIAKTIFSNCKMHRTDLASVNASHCFFNDCDLQDALFEQTNLEKANLTTAFNFNINPNQNNLKKARFSSNGLYGLLKNYDIVVES